MYLIFENNHWIMGWNKAGTAIIIQSKDDRERRVYAHLVGKPFQYDRMQMSQRAPRIEYSGRVPAYIMGKVTMAFARGPRWRK